MVVKLESVIGGENATVSKADHIKMLFTMLSDKQGSIRMFKIGKPDLLDFRDTEIQQLMAFLLLRPEIRLEQLIEWIPTLRQYITDEHIEKKEWEQSEISVKYKNYIEKEKETAEKIAYLENIRLKPDMDYFSIQSLSTEARQKLTRIRPETLGQASRISGISPSDISVLLVLLGR